MDKMSDNKNYCNSLSSYSRWNTKEVKIGGLSIGARQPIRVQSMTTTDTMDTLATVEQSIRMIDAGCELVRVTAPSINEAKNLAFINNLFFGFCLLFCIFRLIFCLCFWC